ncbi:hypothetical protein HMI56_004218, partial [Coelomomyces lativittatus]
MGVKGRFPMFIQRLCRSEGGPMTHSSLNGIAGGKVYAPLDDYEWFLSKLAEFYAQAENDPSNDVIDLCERIDTNDPYELFHFHLDIDFGDELLTPHPIELRNLVRSMVMASLPDSAPVTDLRRQSRAAMKTTDANNQHLHFFGLKVNRLAALYIHSKVLQAVSQRFGSIPESDFGQCDGRFWNRILDNGYNGLRMLGSQKRHKDENQLFKRDLSNVYCVVDETKGDLRRFPPTLDDFKQTSIFALKHHVNDDASTMVFFEFKITPEPEYKVLDVVGLSRCREYDKRWKEEEQEKENKENAENVGNVENVEKELSPLVVKEMEASRRHVETYIFPEGFPFTSTVSKEKMIDELQANSHQLKELFTKYIENPLKRKSNSEELTKTNNFLQSEKNDVQTANFMEQFEFFRQLHTSKFRFQAEFETVTYTAHDIALLLAERTDFFEVPTAQMILGITPSNYGTLTMPFCMKPSRFWLELAQGMALPLAIPASQCGTCANVLQQLHLSIPHVYEMKLNLIPFLTFPYAKTYPIEHVVDLMTMKDETQAWSTCEAKQCILIDESITANHVYALQSMAPFKAMYLDSMVASMPLMAFILPKRCVTLLDFLHQVKRIGIEMQLWDGISGNVFDESMCSLLLDFVFRIFCGVLEAFAPFQIGDISLDTIM